MSRKKGWLGAAFVAATLFFAANALDTGDDGTDIFSRNVAEPLNAAGQPDDGTDKYSIDIFSRNVAEPLNATGQPSLAVDYHGPADASEETTCPADARRSSPYDPFKWIPHKLTKRDPLDKWKRRSRQESYGLVAKNDTATALVGLAAMWCFHLSSDVGPLLVISLMAWCAYKAWRHRRSCCRSRSCCSNSRDWDDGQGYLNH